MRIMLVFDDREMRSEYRLPLERPYLPEVGTSFDDEYPFEDENEEDRTMGAFFKVIEVVDHFRQGYGEVHILLEETDSGPEVFQQYLDDVWFSSGKENQVEEWAKGADIPMPAKPNKA